MAVPKSRKLQEEEAAREQQEHSLPSALSSQSSTAVQESDEILIREVKCCNDFVAIMQFQIETSIAMSDTESTYKNEGIVVGVGPGVADGNSGRLKPTVEVGEIVMFGARNIAAVVESSSPPYEGKKVVIVSERNVLCKIPKKIPFKLIEE